MKSKDTPDGKPKIGSEHAAAMARQGLRELRAAFYPESNVAQPAEYGIWGTKTPGEVAESREVHGREGGDSRARDEEPRRDAPATAVEPRKQPVREELQRE